MTAKASAAQAMAGPELGSTTPENRPKRPRLSDAEIYRMVQESAYYKAEARGFSPGYEERDWLEAEAEIKARLGFV